MIYIIVGIGLFFVAIAYTVTESNAKYLLAGYNTMSAEEREKVDIKSYIAYFKKFHIFLGLSFLIIGLVLTFLIGEKASAVFLGVYPVLAYIYFIWRSSTDGKSLNHQWDKIAIYILIGTLIFVITICALGFREDQLSFDQQPNIFFG